MAELDSKISYLKGLIDGLKMDAEKAETKAIKAIIDVLDEVSDEFKEAYSLIDEIDECLADVENDLYDDECEFNEDEDDDLFEITCPNCDNQVLLDDAMLDEDTIICPNCKEEIEFNFECDHDCDNCK